MAFVEYYTRERIGYIVLNRPEKRNALSPQVVTELKSIFQTAAADAGVILALKISEREVCFK